MLVELLLAASVLAVTAAVVLGLFSASFRAMGASEKRTRGIQHLEAVAAALHTDGVSAPASDRIGDTGFSWTADPAAGSCEHELCPVTVTVHWQERGKEQSVSATTFAPPPEKQRRRP